MKKSRLLAKTDIVFYADGGSRGNPGSAASAAVIIDKHSGAEKSYSISLGTRTNNEAEYEAVILALKKIKALYGKAKIQSLTIEGNLDSELVVKQLTHKYKILDPKIQPLFITVWNLLLDFGKVTFHHVPRIQNQLADKLVNKELDKGLSGLFSSVRE